MLSSRPKYLTNICQSRSPHMDGCRLLTGVSPIKLERKVIFTYIPYQSNVTKWRIRPRLSGVPPHENIDTCTLITCRCFPTVHLIDLPDAARTNWNVLFILAGDECACEWSTSSSCYTLSDGQHNHYDELILGFLEKFRVVTLKLLLRVVTL